MLLRIRTRVVGATISTLFSQVTGMQQQPVAIPENVRTLSQTLENVGVSMDVGQEVKTLLEDLFGRFALSCEFSTETL